MNDLQNLLNDSSFIKKLNEDLENGAVICFVTDTVWGIGCLPTSQAGVDKIYEIKGRDRSKPLILMSDKLQNLLPYTKDLPQSAKDAANKHFPGALTIVCEKSEQCPDFITSNKNTVGIRVPNNEVFKALCSLINGHVLATTSANKSNEPSAKNYEEANIALKGLVDYIFQDYGYGAQGLESTVALFTDKEIKIFRQGAIKL